jgi:hypothetical protein
LRGQTDGNDFRLFSPLAAPQRRALEERRALAGLLLLALPACDSGGEDPSEKDRCEDEEALNTGEIGDCQYPANSAPDAKASVDPSTVEVAQTVTFDASGSSYEPEALE